jgi:hypothetical protein
MSTKPLELVFSDVWGPAPTSVGRFSYYVTFIDDFSKFSWIYLIKKKSEVFQVFQNFQTLVERNLIVKSLPSKQIGEVNMKNYTPFSQKWVYPIMCLALMPINKMGQQNASIATLSRWA